MNNLDEMNLSLAKIIACDVANELIGLSKDNKINDKYDPKIFEYLKECEEPEFYISDRVRCSDQIDEHNMKVRESFFAYILQLENIPVCIITTNIDNQETRTWSYNIHYLNDPEATMIINYGMFSIISLLDYGLYLIDHKFHYYTISEPLPGGKDVTKTLQDLYPIAEIKEKNKLDINLLSNTKIDVSIKDYDYNSIDKKDIENINNYLKDNEDEFLNCKIVGPIPRYQYHFTDLENIEVCDYDKENDSYMFMLIKDNDVKGYLYYDSFDGQDGVNINQLQLNFDNTYYVDLAEVGFIFEDRIVSDQQPYSLLDRLVIKQIQSKIRNDKPSFNTYDLVK